MQLIDLLRAKGTQVATVHADATLQEVVDRMVDHNIGSLVVVPLGQPSVVLGIITERDILRACATRRLSLAQQCVAEVMSRDLLTGSLHDEVEAIMGLMTEHRIRHLPIVEDGRLRGIISIGDIVKAQHDALSVENHYLRNYLLG